jgi:ubiquinone/menaquinone biosynthesis C-methylase UbiE
VQFIGACSTRLPLADNSIDLTVTIRLFHHLLSRAHRVAILAEMNRVTRQRIILTFYRRGTIHQAQRMVKNVRPGGKRLAFHSEGQFLREIGEAGLELDRLVKLKRAVHSQTFAVLRPA